MLNEIIGPGHKYAEKKQGYGLCKELKPKLPFLATKNTAHSYMAVFPGRDDRSDKDRPDHDEPSGFLHGRRRPLEEYPGHNLYEDEYRHSDNGDYASSVFGNMENPQQPVDTNFQCDPRIQGRSFEIALGSGGCCFSYLA